MKIQPVIKNSGLNWIRTHCLISFRAETWHYRIFPDFSAPTFQNSTLKMADDKGACIKSEAKHVSLVEIFDDISLENLPT